MRRYLLSFIIFVVFFVGCMLLIYSRCRQIQADHLQLHLTTEEAAIMSSIHTYSLLAQAINDEVIQTDRVLQLVHAIVTSEGQPRNIARGKLYRLLDPVYQRLRGKQVRQLHFHFPDGRSMLRFHAPSRSDDSLVGVRPSVVMVNRDHQEIHGFESGKIFHGFRHVYPLFYHGEAIGSVEISTSFYQIREEFKHLSEADHDHLAESGQTQLAFLLYRPEMWGKLFNDLQAIYEPSALSADYVLERADRIQSICSESIPQSPLVDKMQGKLAGNSEVLRQLKAQKSFALAVYYGGHPYTVVFHSVYNTLGKHAAYIMTVTPEPFLAKIRDDGVLMGLFVGLLLIAVLLYRFRFLAVDDREKRQALFLSNISDNLGMALYTTNRDGEISFANPAMEYLLGYQHQEMVGCNAHALFHQSQADNASGCICEQVLRTNQTIHATTYKFIDRVGNAFPVEVVCSPLREHKQVIGTATIFQDISRRCAQEEQLKQAQEELVKVNASLEQLASHDGLTGVDNRRSFDVQLDRFWRTALRQQRPLGLLMIDIDHFKRYNDHFGHQQGDQCLQQVARILQQSCKRPHDLVARYGGEEFAVLLPETATADCYQVARRIQQGIAQRALPHPKAEELGIVSLSIGCCSLIPQAGQQPEDLVLIADQCLYRAKEQGRNRICSQTAPSTD